MSDQHAWGFEVRAIGEPPLEGVHVQWPPMPADCRISLLGSFRRRFLTDPLRLGGAVTLPAYPPTFLQVERPDHTAAIVHFVRISEQTEHAREVRTLSALAVLLTGIDRSADERAIQRAAQLVNETGMRIELARFHEAVAGTRPLAVLACANRASLSDPSKHVIFSAVAQAFFEQLGVEGRAQPSDDLPTFGD